ARPDCGGEPVNPQAQDLSYSFPFLIRALYHRLLGPAECLKAAAAHRLTNQNSKVVQLAFRLQQFALAQRRFRANSDGLGNQALSGALLSQVHHLAHMDLLVLCDLVRNVDLMRVICMAVDRGVHLCIEITAVKVSSENVASIICHAPGKKRRTRTEAEAL